MSITISTQGLKGKVTKTKTILRPFRATSTKPSPVPIHTHLNSKEIRNSQRIHSLPYERHPFTQPLHIKTLRPNPLS